LSNQTSSLLSLGAARQSLTGQAYRKLEEMIATLELPPGAVLSEAQLIEALDIGRTPIREALQRLAVEGLVEILPRKGVLVSDTNPQKQLLLLEVRRELDRLMARTGAVRASTDEREQFKVIADNMEATATARDGVAFMRHDVKFNALLAAACHNEYAKRAMRLINGLSRRFWFMHFQRSADLPLCARLHANMARAIGAGDPEGAAIAADALVDYVEIFTRATIDIAP
jgi:DNA-binding GntR family transcriptional regulator